MSHGNSSSEALASGSKCNFQLHLFFAGTHRQPRYLTDSTGKVVAAWKTRDAFEIWQGEVGALVFVVLIDHRRWRFEGLREWHYTGFGERENRVMAMLLPDESS